MSSMDPINLEEVWKELNAESRENSANRFLIRRVLPESQLDLFLGVEKPNYKKLLIVKANREAVKLAKNFPESKGILTKTAVLPDEKDDRESLIIALKDDKFADLFTSLAIDMISSLLDAKNDIEIVKTSLFRLKKWQSFMEHYRDGLSDETIRGLFGELYFLSSIVLSKYGIQGIKSWKGFQNTNQDFYFKNTAVEVKTTTGREPLSIRIASEKQLDKSGYPNLFIFHISLDKVDENGISLPELILNIRNKIAGNNDLVEYFEAGLFAIGYIDTHKEKYSEKFLVQESSFYEISDSFPKIIESTLPNGIDDVQYSISLSECKEFTSEEEKVIELLKYE